MLIIKMTELCCTIKIGRANLLLHSFRQRAGRAQVQARLGHLRLSAEVCAAGPASLAALSALRRHLVRLHAADELASAAHVVRIRVQVLLVGVTWGFENCARCSSSKACCPHQAVLHTLVPTSKQPGSTLDV